MQRLIIKTYRSDGKTYSDTETHPLIYTSPHQFLMDLECTARETYLAYQSHHLEDIRLKEAYQAELVLNAHLKKNKVSTLASIAWHEHHTKGVGPHFELGGFIFNATHYIENIQGILRFNSPEVFTVDEYFRDVEFHTGIKK